MKHLFAAVLAFALLGAPWIALNRSEYVSAITRVFQEASIQVAAAITHDPKTIAKLQEKYNASRAGEKQQKIRVLIVPGHEPDYGGAEFGKVKERELVVTLSQDLAGFLRDDPAYQVFVTRNDAEWAPDFAAYFKEHWADIIDWQKSYKAEMSKLVSLGAIAKPVSSVYHNTAPQGVAIRLWGIMKWAKDNDIDIIVHVHLNDYPGHPGGAEGEHSGFAIYVPSSQYLNSTTTHAIADSVFRRLSKYNPVSSLAGESSGIVDEPELIAIGANNTSDAPSMLIEYGYIYEPQFVNPETRDLALKDLAFQTYLGLQDFFGSNANVANTYDTLMLPHSWHTPLAKGAIGEDVFALQTAMLIDGVYPPASKTKNECPRTGKLGPCTREALQKFQDKYGVTGEKGTVGGKTLEVLNGKYGLRAI